jgi:hypothetical protein
MRKSILVGLLAFIILIVAALSITWFYRASNMKKDIAAAFASVVIGDTKITYDDITTSGFPLTMDVTIVNPHIVTNVTKLADQIDFEKTLKLERLPQWNEDITIDGNLRLSVNMFSNKFKIQLDGNVISKSNIAGKDIGSITQPGGPTVCELTTSNNSGLLGNLWNLRAWMSDSSSFLRELRSMDCITPPLTVTATASNAKAFSSGGVRLYISRAPKGEMSDLRFYLTAKDSEATPAYDDIYGSYMQALAPGSKFVSPAIYGKQNIEFDSTYSGSENLSGPNFKNLPLEAKITRLYISNAAYQLNGSLEVNNKYKDNIRNISFGYKLELAGNDMLTNMLRSSLHDRFSNIGSSPAAATDNREQRETRKKIALIPQEKTGQLINFIVPDFARLGKITTAIDLNYSGDDKLNAFQAELKALELSATPYGITATGAGQKSGDSPLAGNISIRCNNCMALVDNGVAYLKGLHQALTLLSPNKLQEFNLSQNTVDGIKDFLESLSPEGVDGNKDNLKFDIVNNGKTISVNGKGLMEVAQIFSQTVAPTLPKGAMAPPAVGPAGTNPPPAAPAANPQQAAPKSNNKRK